MRLTPAAASRAPCRAGTHAGSPLSAVAAGTARPQPFSHTHAGTGACAHTARGTITPGAAVHQEGPHTWPQGLPAAEAGPGLLQARRLPALRALLLLLRLQRLRGALGGHLLRLQAGVQQAGQLRHVAQAGRAACAGHQASPSRPRMARVTCARLLACCSNWHPSCAATVHAASPATCAAQTRKKLHLRRLGRSRRPGRAPAAWVAPRPPRPSRAAWCPAWRT